jgi:hypothetical protein
LFFLGSLAVVHASWCFTTTIDRWFSIVSERSRILDHLSVVLIQPHAFFFLAEN